ncbi:Life-span regulatory factor [Nakaseomyces bracarensis]|uniref:Life-span regulatory factor n=1 Tax=Nakaseomyces bracarensis TaxID=273131 RepID=A0ABR4NTA3_9SACH
MAAFNDYCIVCEKLLDGPDIYCSDACRQRDTVGKVRALTEPLLKSPLIPAQKDEPSELDELNLPVCETLVVPRHMGHFEELYPMSEASDEQTAADNYKLWLEKYKLLLG